MRERDLKAERDLQTPFEGGGSLRSQGFREGKEVTLLRPWLARERLHRSRPYNTLTFNDEN